jgi:hypothetical protein
MKNLQSNLMFMTLEEKWGYSLLDFIFGEQIQKENQNGAFNLLDKNIFRIGIPIIIGTYGLDRNSKEKSK